MNYQADEYLCPCHKPGACNISYKTLHFCIPCGYCKSGTFTSVLFMVCGFVLDGRRIVLVWNKVEKAPKVQKMKAKNNNETTKKG